MDLLKHAESEPRQNRTDIIYTKNSYEGICHQSCYGSIVNNASGVYFERTLNMKYQEMPSRSRAASKFGTLVEFGKVSTMIPVKPLSVRLSRSV